MGCALRKDQLWREGAEVLRRAISSEPAKVVALKLQVTPRHARNLQTGECETGWAVFMNAATEYAQVRDFVSRALAFDQTEARLAQIQRLAASMPEEGDKET